jgi:LysR family nod box-dependent transcriptional activator
VASSHAPHRRSARDSALAEGELTFDRYVNAGHVVMHPHAIVSDSFENSFLTRYGVSRTVAVRTNGFAMLPALVSGTEYIATVHARLAERLLQSFPLVSHPCPIKIEPMRQCIQWHKYRQQDAGIQRLRPIAAEATLHMDRAYQLAPPRP